MPRKPQRYRLTFEFTLRNPADYAAVRAQVRSMQVHLETYFEFATELVVIEKVTENLYPEPAEGRGAPDSQ